MNSDNPNADQSIERQTKLNGLSSDYRIRLRRWFELSKPAFGPIMGPSIGFLLLFALMYSGIILLHFVLVGIVLQLVLVPALIMGLHLVCQSQLKGEPWTFSTFFSGFRWNPPLIVWALHLLFIPCLLLTPYAALVFICAIIWPREAPAFISGGLAALLLGSICAAVYFLVRLSAFSHFLIIDRDCSAIEALKGSWILSRGHFWSLFAINLLLMLVVYLIGLLTFGIGLLFAIPRAILTLNAGYLLIAGADPLPGIERDSEKSVKKRLLPGWSPLIAIPTIGLVFGIAYGFATQSGRFARQKADWESRSREYAQWDDEERKRAEIRADNLLNFFRDRHCWAMPLRRNRMPFPPLDDKGAGQNANRRMLVLGYSGMLKARPKLQVGIATGPDRFRVATENDSLRGLSSIRERWRRIFVQKFAKALDRDEVEAALVEWSPADVSVRPADPLPSGTPVPLDKARQLTGKQFLDLVERSDDIE